MNMEDGEPKLSEPQRVSSIRSPNHPYKSKDILDLRVTEIPYLVEKLVPAHEPFGIYGDGGSMKTWFALTLAKCACTGTVFLDEFNIPKPIPIIYLDGECGAERLCIRFNKLGITAEMPIYVYTEKSLYGLDLLNSSFDSTLEDLIKQTEIEKGTPIIVILDSFSRFFGGNENKASDVSNAMNRISKACRINNISFGIVHHFRKPGRGGKGGIVSSRVRGSSDFINAISVGICLEKLFKSENVNMISIKSRDHLSFSQKTLELSDGGLILAMNQSYATSDDNKETKAMGCILEMIPNVGATIMNNELVKEMGDKYSIKRGTVENARDRLEKDGKIEKSEGKPIQIKRIKI